MSGNLLFNVQNHSFLSGLQEFHSIGEWNFHSFTFREHLRHLPVRASRENLALSRRRETSPILPLPPVKPGYAPADK